MDWTNTLDLFFPRRCAVCDELLSYGTRGICKDCENRLPNVKEPRCFCCGRTLEDPEEEYCQECQENPHLFVRAFPLFQYIPPVSDAMAAMKYQGRAEYAGFYGTLLGEQFRKDWMELRPDCLVPVPVHPNRKRKRGYNQAELLAEAMSEVTGIPVRKKLLIRSADTKAQKKLSKEGRRGNLAAAFSCEEEAPPCVVLVDDIFTTGATADACTKSLLQAGARRVYVAAVCC